MTDEAREAQRAYKRAWSAANKDKIKKYNAAYWEKQAAQKRQKAAESTAPAAEATA